MADSGDIGPLWISAKRQTTGKGRRGREWVSKTGNLFCTGLFPYTRTPSAAAQLSFVAALAVYDTISHFRPHDHTRIKWPNDVLLDGKKISGILLESGTTNGQLWVAVGIGINIASAPQDVQYPTTFLHADVVEQQRPFMSDVKTALFERFATWLKLYNQNGFEALRTTWLARAQGIGGPVSAKLLNKTIKGTAIGMDADGALEVKTHLGNTVKIHAGDVFFS